MGKSEITKGLTMKFLPFVLLLSIVFASNWWIMTFNLSVDWLDILTFAILEAVGLVIVAEGFTHLGTKDDLSGAVAGAVAIWLLGGIAMLTGVLQVFNIIDIYTGTGELFVIINFVLIMDMIVLLGMTIWEVVFSRKLLIHAPHKEA